MTQLDEQMIRGVVDEVVKLVSKGFAGRTSPAVGAGVAATVTPPGVIGATAGVAGRFGQFTDVDEAVAAAAKAQRSLAKRSLAQREAICDIIKTICATQADELGRLEYEETRIGHAAHKPEKLQLVAQTITAVDGLRTDCYSGDHGITLDEAGPWGVIGVITPVTHSLPTLACNAIQMIAAGNALVCNPHPGGANIAAIGAERFNRAIHQATGIDNLVSVIAKPTLDSAKAIFGHPGVAILAVTGGPGVVAAGLKSGKRAICAGPGNPPVVVDHTADLANAARCVIDSGGYDNNLLCLAEKEVFVVAEVYEEFLDAMDQAGAYRLSAEQMKQLGLTVIGPVGPEGYPHANRDYVGAGPAELGKLIGVSVPAGCRMLFGPAELKDPLVQAEQMMSVMPVVRADTFEQAVDMALDAEHGFGHTAVIHSRLVDHMTYMGKAMNTTIYVKNGPAAAGNGVGGEGFTSYSIACSTGEGIATPMTYTRWRRCTMVDNLRIV